MQTYKSTANTCVPTTHLIYEMEYDHHFQSPHVPLHPIQFSLPWSSYSSEFGGFKLYTNK